MRTISVKERAKKLGVGMPTMYDWRKSYPEAWSGAAARSITGANGTNGTIATSSTINSTSTQPASQSRSTTTSSFVRPDGLGPEAEPEETFGGRGPGVLPPELVEQLAKEGALATNDEIAAVHATTLDDDAGPGAAPYINETIDLTLHLKQSTLAPRVKENWDRLLLNFKHFGAA
ncbi:hypothetical protein A4X13_0g5968 [Tilletia indica]|uniref:Uncharacterized protein n=1 Tax=Tilletia indica TaxID=43049 RepID=A0A8T8SSR6_9BASI|nr:hypothetical protein A4X13_0g5968 [Tilletia indica]